MFESTQGRKGIAFVGGGLARWQARRVLDYINANLESRLAVKEIAGAVNLSSSHFCRAFKHTFGMTVHLWVMHRRVEVAQELMVHTQGALTEIALRCGLSDQSHLTRWFRRVVGTTPASWRRENYGRSMRHINGRCALGRVDSDAALRGPT